jgi:hypothetical protein
MKMGITLIKLTISWDVEAADYVARRIRNGGAHEKKE